MARLGRSQVPYRPRRRGVEAPPVVYDPVRVNRTDQNRPRQAVLSRRAHARLSPPTVIAPPVVYAPVKFAITDVERPRHILARASQTYWLRPALFAPAPAPPLKVKTVAVTRNPARRSTHSKLRPPLLAATGTTFNDTVTGTITWSGSASETHTHSSTASGTITWSGTATQSHTHSSSPSGTITWSGTSTESQTHSSSPSGTVTWSGSQTQLQSHSSSPSGTMTWSGSQSQSTVHTSSASGTITWSGSLSESYQPPGFVAPTGSDDTAVQFHIGHLQ